MTELTNAARDVLAERKRQVEKENWSPEHDDEHDDREMARAAACYVIASLVNIPDRNSFADDIVAACWPWGAGWWKPKSERENLVRAGALILAEIERLDRAGEGHEHD